MPAPAAQALPSRPTAPPWWPVALASIVALALALRLPWLGALPNPSGDEGNWTLFGLDVLEGRAPHLTPDARFVSTLFARLIALSFRAFGVTFRAARLVPAVGLVACLVAAALLLRRLSLPRAALVAAALLAVHPWSVLWSRTVTVPYALALGLSVVGPLAVLAAARSGSALALVVAGQCLALGLHFTPLALIPAAAVAWWIVAARRDLLRRPGALASAALAALHAAPILLGAAAVAGQRSVEPARWLVHLPARLHVYALTVLGGWSGEATLRHFTGTEHARPAEWALGLAAVALLALALRPDARDGAGHVLARLARAHLALSLVGLPLLLAPARPWNLPAIDAERYLFATLAPAIVAVSLLAEDRRPRLRAAALLAVAALALGPTARAARYFLAGGSPDRGFYTLAGGGGYRGWKATRARIAVADLVRREVDRLRAGRPAMIVVSDYALHPLTFANRRGGSWCHDISKAPLPDEPARRHFFVTWSDGLLAPGFGPPEELAAHGALRALMRSGRFAGLRRERAWTQPDGSALVELWSADRATARPAE